MNKTYIAIIAVAAVIVIAVFGVLPVAMGGAGGLFVAIPTFTAPPVATMPPSAPLNAAQPATQTPSEVATATMLPDPTATIVCVLASEALNFRTGPGTGNDIYTVLLRGTRLVKNSQAISAVDGSLWYQVTMPDGMGGWVAARYVGGCP